ncbi:MAG: flavin reductase family protein [Alphaproteobacteria bacterium]
MLITSENFKQCLSRFATGVCIVSAEDSINKEIIGVTISSFTSVSLKPLLILFCISKNYYSHQIFTKEKCFVVSILNENQKEISKNFAKHTIDKWDGIKIINSQILKLPLIQGSIAYLECNKYAEYDGGDHTIFVGEVINSEILSQEKPLIHYKSGYYSLK